MVQKCKRKTLQWQKQILCNKIITENSDLAFCIKCGNFSFNQNLLGLYYFFSEKKYPIINEK